jgi:hypothetical protein
MADGWVDRNAPSTAEADVDAYAAGYRRVMSEITWVRSRGWMPTERQPLMQIMRVYSAARGGKFVGGQRPEWLHGRADALRDLLRQPPTPIA